MKPSNSQTFKLSLLPMMAGFFVMGFADIVGTVVNQVKSECALDDVTAGFLPSMIFVWFFLISLPAGVLSGRVGRKNTVLVSLAVTVGAMFLPLAGGAGRPWPYFAAFALIGIGNTVLQAALPALLGNVTPPELLTSRISLGQFVKAICAALTPVFIYLAASVMGNWRLVFPIYGALAIVVAAWLALAPIPDEREEVRSRGTRDPTAGGRQNTAAARTTFGSCFALLRNPLILALTVGIFFAVGLDVGFSVAIPEFLKGAYKMDVNAAGTGPTVYFIGKTIAAAVGAVLFAKVSPAKCFPWCIGLSVLAVAGIFACPNPVAFLACVFVAALASANTFGMCMGIALDRMPEKANEITALMVMAIAGGAVIPPILGFAQKQAGCAGLVWVLLACLAYLAVLGFLAMPRVRAGQGRERVLTHRIGRTALVAAALCAATVTCVRAGNATAVKPIRDGHSHNDYWRKRPMLDALDHGFCSVEADVFLRDGEFWVGHSKKEIPLRRSLESIYLKTLKEQIARNGGSVYPGGGTFYLWIDIKEDAEIAWAALSPLLEKYRDILCGVKDGVRTPGPVQVILSGNRPVQSFENAKGKTFYAMLDGRFGELDDPKRPAWLMGAVNECWKDVCSWRGKGDFPADQRARLAVLVDKAHRSGRLVRFWGAPQTPAFWTELRRLKVDFINTDHLTTFRNFDREARQSEKLIVPRSTVNKFKKEAVQ